MARAQKKIYFRENGRKIMFQFLVQHKNNFVCENFRESTIKCSYNSSCQCKVMVETSMKMPKNGYTVFSLFFLLKTTPLSLTCCLEKGPLDLKN